MWNIPRSIVQRMVAEALRHAPAECVGVLSGLGRDAHACHPLPNIAADPHHFLADPAAQIDLFRRLRTEGGAPIAIYHSHPSGAAWPSAEDLAQAWHPEMLYLIIALGVAGRVEVHGFLLRDGRATPQEIRVVEGPTPGMGR